MEWLEVDRFLDALEWWQMALVLVTSILISVIIVVFIIYLVMRFVDKRRVTFFDTLYRLFSKKSRVFNPSDLARQYNSTPSTPREVYEPAKFPIPELLVEIEDNLKIVNEFSGENLLPFKSDVWDASRYSTQKLPINLREQLVDVYSDIHLSNQIIRVSTELGHRSSFLNERYRKRITTIAEKLKRIKRNIELGTLTEHIGR